MLQPHDPSNTNPALVLDGTVVEEQHAGSSHVVLGPGEVSRILIKLMQLEVSKRCPWACLWRK